MTALFEIRDNAIFIPSASLYLDALKKKEFGYISHAHIDHLARHKQILCTPVTADLVSLRLKNPQFHILPFFKKIQINDVKISLLPAGHILGSAQIFLETADGSLLYTGDFKTRNSRTAESFVLQKCDILIMETTFGMPHYIFPDREELEFNLIQLLQNKLHHGYTPVVCAYSLGKGQDVLHLLGHAGLPLAVDYSILRYARIYEQYGIDFGSYEKLKRRELQGKVILLPTHLRNDRFIQNLNKKYTIYLSGWGVDKSAAYRFGVDQVFPLSDHADFNEMLTLVEKLEPKIIYCTHGFNDFVFYLRKRGFDAHPLSKPAQMDLFE
jgi:Cft2 family RNA processing exonuclease